MSVKRFFPLTNAQKSIWQIAKFYPDTTFINIAATIRIKEPVQFGLLNKAINLAIKHNDAMRMRIVEYGTEPKQYFSDFEEQTFEFKDFNYPSGADDLRQWEESSSRTGMKLIDSDICMFTLLKISDHAGGFFVKCHHIAMDAWSMTLLVRQILQNYTNLKKNAQYAGEPQPLYQDHILSEMDVMEKQVRLEKHRLFWDEMFSTVPEFTALTNSTVVDTDAARETFSLPDRLSLLINDFSSANKVSPICILFAVLSICLYQLTSKHDIVIGTPVLNRSGVKMKNTMGMFISTVPFRIKLNPNLEFTTFVKDIARQWKILLKHQNYPFDAILKNFRETHGVNSRLFDVSLSFQNSTFKISEVDFSADWLFNGSQLNSFTIHISDREERGTYTVDYDYLKHAFSYDEISRMHEYITTLLNHSLTKPGLKICDIQILSPEEQNRLLWQFNKTEREFPLEETIVSLFERQVSRTPEKVAVVFENQEFTYDHLNRRANQLAAFLRSKGVKKDSVVGLIVDRSIELIVGILAVLKAGGAYLPMDPTLPVDRIEFMLSDSNCQLALTHMTTSRPKLTFVARSFELTNQKLYQGNCVNLHDGPVPDNLACVIYTSGSTGKPKGVMVEHKNLTNLVNWFREVIEPENKTAVSIANISFDIFFKETIFPLLFGMRVILANKQEATVPYLLCDLLNRHRVNFMQATPSRMKAILSHRPRFALAYLTEIIIGGEIFPENLLAQLQQVTRAKIFNAYGPTETTICATFKHLKESESITIGKPIANTQIYILDDKLQPVPVGVTGEMYIGGSGLARGYINNQQLTKERFIANPFIPGSLMYKTGDLAKWRGNGEIEYVGRNDYQVKIRGFRIELGEIEDCLLKYPGVKDAVVTCREDGPNRKYLCAYLTTNKNMSIQKLKESLSNYLPDYMIPAHFITLDSLPLTPNGKVDRLALPVIDRGIDHEQNYAPPRNFIEQKLVELWAKTLDLPNVGIDDNFFALGGDSLAILEILSGLFPNDWGISAQDFYDYQTIRLIAEKISGAKNEHGILDVKSVVNLRARPARQPEPFIGATGNVLLTGATGFLGIHILHELLNTTSDKVYCLVRGKEGPKRLRQLLRFYFPSLSNSLFADRVEVVNGDICQELFGCTDTQYAQLGEHISYVIHAAALVKHYGLYEDFYQTNVHGTANVINFCIKYGIKLNHISTTSVSGTYQACQPGVKRFTLTTSTKNRDYHNNIYVRSKVEAENLITKAVELGLAATVFRVGLVTGRHSDGQFQKNINENAFYRLLKSIIMLEAIPIDVAHKELEFTPVDLCAKAIVKIISAKAAQAACIQVYNHKTIRFGNLLPVFVKKGIDVKVMSRKSFDNLLSSIACTDSGAEILSGIIVDPSLKASFSSIPSFKIDSTMSVGLLDKLGFAWPDIDEGYLIRLLDYMQQVGFLKQISTLG